LSILRDDVRGERGGVKWGNGECVMFNVTDGVAGGMVNDQWSMVNGWNGSGTGGKSGKIETGESSRFSELRGKKKVSALFVDVNETEGAWIK